MKKQSYIISYQEPVLDEGDGGGNPPAKPPATNATFTQADLDAKLAEHTAELKKQQQSALAELEALKGKATLTTKERTALESKIEELTIQSLTKEELAKRDTEKLRKKHDLELTSAVSERDQWKTKYTETTILRSLSDAAVASEAYNPQQIIAILQHKTELKETVDAEGKPTGHLEARVKLQDTKDGQVIELDLTATEAVKRMRDIEGYQNLFKGLGQGGLGDHNRGSGGKVDVTKLSPAQYREARAKGLIPGIPKA